MEQDKDKDTQHEDVFSEKGLKLKDTAIDIVLSYKMMKNGNIIQMW